MRLIPNHNARFDAGFAEERGFQYMPINNSVAYTCDVVPVKYDSLDEVANLINDGDFVRYRNSGSVKFTPEHIAAHWAVLAALQRRKIDGEPASSFDPQPDLEFLADETGAEFSVEGAVGIAFMLDSYIDNSSFEAPR